MRNELFTTNDDDNKECSLRVRVSVKEKRLFYEVCENQGMTPSKVIRQMMKEYVKQYKDADII